MARGSSSKPLNAVRLWLGNGVGIELESTEKIDKLIKKAEEIAAKIEIDAHTVKFKTK